MVETRLKTLLASLAIPFDGFTGKAISELDGEPIYSTDDIINFIATFRTAEYPLQKEDK